MMELVFTLIFMIPLVFMGLNFWSFLIMFFLLNFKFMMSLGLNFMFIKLSYFLGMDLLSYFMILLSLWICSLMILASESFYKNEYYWELFLLMILTLLMSLILTFSSLNIFSFYIFFEISLIPTLFLIIGWGNQPERILAGVYLLFYTFLVSLPMLLVLFFLYEYFFTLDFYFFFSINNLVLYLCTNLVFFIKIPMFFIHLWLPKAHVEAPVSGSMILAGVLLKLGGYGLIRVMKMFTQIGMKINFIFITISLIGSIFISLLCIRQSDMKMLIAYSSISHMGIVLSGILTFNIWGLWGSFILMLAHGLCSSGLFCLANMAYERSHSRSIYLNKGMMNIMPNLSLWWFLLCSSNMAAPPSLNLLGEIMLINSLFMYSKIVMFVLFMLIFFSAVYSLFLYSFTQHGSFYSGLFSFSIVNIREYLLLFLHWIPLNILIMKSEYFMLG
uniref:NADH-ubiquinone oxidoreductase chain 4 n=1 Tax=Curculionidae sp. 1 AH-2016 TaxID=1903827 RepID=A0A343C2M5_9CUCU|nr:NADH dehydrogenase subunit 4 [Curculionidae sp. 1 AH-2016]